MRRIKDSRALQLTVDQFYDSLFYRRDKTKFRFPEQRLLELLDPAVVFPTILHEEKDNYVNKLLNNLDRIRRASPRAIESWIILFNEILPVSRMTEAFANAITAALCYEEMREKEFPEVFQKLHIKTCVYCHSQLTVIVDKEFYKNATGNFQPGDVMHRIAKLELDHARSKRDYPFLSSTFYNLYPTCANCNKSKSDNASNFRLYADEGGLDVFTFILDNQSVVDYLVSRQLDDIKIDFKHINDDLKERRLYNALFDISEIYGTQLDIVEELIHKKQAYSKMYNKSLVDQFEDLFIDKALIKRLVIGNYDQAEDVHKRPMAKFAQDIARDLGLI